MVVLGNDWLQFLVGNIVWSILMFQGQNMLKGVECTIPREVIWEVPNGNEVMYY